MLPTHTPAHACHVLSRTALGGILAAATLTVGCGSTTLPCMQYRPQMLTRTVMMRGYGAIRVTEQAMVCTHRASSMEEGLTGP